MLGHMGAEPSTAATNDRVAPARPLTSSTQCASAPSTGTGTPASGRPSEDRSSEWAWLRHSCFRHAIWRLAEETEGVTSRVEHDPNGFLRLNLGRARTARDGPLDCVDQFVDPDVKVLRCDLALRLGGPTRSLPLLLELEIQSEVGSLHLSPTRILRFAWTRRIGCGDRCMQEVRVELRELARSRSPERDGRQSDRWLVRLRHEIQFRIRSARRAHLPRPRASAHSASRMAKGQRDTRPARRGRPQHAGAVATESPRRPARDSAR